LQQVHDFEPVLYKDLDGETQFDDEAWWRNVKFVKRLFPCHDTMMWEKPLPRFCVRDLRKQGFKQVPKSQACYCYRCFGICPTYGWRLDKKGRWWMPRYEFERWYWTRWKSVYSRAKS